MAYFYLSFMLRVEVDDYEIQICI